MPDEPANPPRQRRDRAEVIARRLTDLRREHGLSQGAFGALVGTSQATVSRWEDPESGSTPSALELAELAEHFGVEPGWLLGLSEHRQALPAGQAVIDQALLDAFAAAATPGELDALLGREMSFGTVWAEIPPGAEVVALPEALRRVRAVDRRVRALYPDLWQRWAELVLR